MNRFLMGVYEDLVEECHLSMLHDNTNISPLMVHAQQVEETRLKMKNREAKKARSYKCGFSKGRLDI